MNLPLPPTRPAGCVVDKVQSTLHHKVLQNVQMPSGQALATELPSAAPTSRAPSYPVGIVGTRTIASRLQTLSNFCYPFVRSHDLASCVTSQTSRVTLSHLSLSLPLQPCLSTTLSQLQSYPAFQTLLSSPRDPPLSCTRVAKMFLFQKKKTPQGTASELKSDQGTH